MLLVKIVGVWVATGSDLGNTTLVQALGLTTNLLGGLGWSTCPLCLTKSKGEGWDQDKDGWSLGSAEGAGVDKGEAKEALTSGGALCQMPTLFKQSHYCSPCFMYWVSAQSAIK